MEIDDAEARVVMYFQDFNKLVQENRLQSWIGRSNPADASFRARMKTRCTLLVENLQPLMPRTQVQRLVEFEARACRSDDRALYKLIVEQAKLQHKFHKQTQELKVQRDGPKRSTPHPRKRRRGRKRGNQWGGRLIGSGRQTHRHRATAA
ncbi:hypothetical protein F441_16066 [Phytophthora nicotianae CJ01A1]|uniref:Uncharacterized protein n=1 Tax=Phytophthora nicotianae CJ01A1 TaxID=1317063 RepID=W2WBI5_PHYNI|nr:hypothetical protein F441_16066 [Phytophthora nicotianae CJ01A1]